MSLDEGTSRFIGRIYEAAYDADAWQTVMHELLRRTRSRLAFVACADVRHRVYSRTEFYGPENSAFARGVEDYALGMHSMDPSLLWASQHPHARVCDTRGLMRDDEFRQLEYVKWQRSRFGSTHWRVLYTPPVDSLSFALSLHPATSEGAPGDEERALHRLVFEHMERALRLAARPPDLSATSDAVIILDTSGCVLSMSEPAERLLNSGDGLLLDRRRLVAASAELTSRLDQAVSSVLKSSTLGGTGGGVRIPRTSGLPDWLVLVSPCPRHLEHLPVRTPGAIVRLVDTDPNVGLSTAHSDLFELTRREAEVAEALLAGHSIESLCALLGISRNTAKVHLKSIFRKTGTNRQSELIHLLAQVARS